MNKFSQTLLSVSIASIGFSSAAFSMGTCLEKHRRPVYGIAGDSVKTLTRDAGWMKLTAALGPFAYASPAAENGAQRKYRLYSVYWDENSGGKVNVEVKFDLPGSEDPVFTLPRVASGWGTKADGYSDYFQFGNGYTEINRGHGDVLARLNSTAPYNNSAQIQWLELITYDCY